ncbi:unnamed protein product [Rangifer tarandus platyrhynchus]|uniref:Uncharacterized protein n=2 Tax=Rangifer tarandus platyrhynchus TaxID=3082113 RepID=A0ACB0EUA1_RANTA|nr:unnamed protein product [Rangifer tarandus platyrhynchus]CAI9704119.1 unnamed protein product [Rangifer tarandus platyrhynchus]
MFIKTSAGGKRGLRPPGAARADPRPGHQQRGTATLWAPAALPGAARSLAVCRGWRPRARSPARLTPTPQERAEEPSRGSPRGRGRGRGAPAPITWVSNRQQPMGARIRRCVCSEPAAGARRELKHPCAPGRDRDAKRLPKWVRLSCREPLAADGRAKDRK